MKQCLSSGKFGLGHLPKCGENLFRGVFPMLHPRDPALVDWGQDHILKPFPACYPVCESSGLALGFR